MGHASGQRADGFHLFHVPQTLLQPAAHLLDLLVFGEILDHGLALLNRYGRVVCCGRIAEYLKAPGETYRLRNWDAIGRQNATMRGFFIYDLAEHFARAEQQMAQWIADGRMQYLEDVLEGWNG